MWGWFKADLGRGNRRGEKGETAGFVSRCTIVATENFNSAVWTAEAMVQTLEEFCFHLSTLLCLVPFSGDRLKKKKLV